MGIRFEPYHSREHAASKGASRSQNTSLDLKQEIDLESQHHKKGTSTSSPDTDGDLEEKIDAERTDTEETNNESTTARSEDQQTIAQRRRISKPPSLMYARPEDLIIVVPGQESEPEDSVHAKKGKDAQRAAANLSRRSSIASARSRSTSSVHSATTTYTTVSVTTEGGRTRRRLSKRRARTEYGGSVMGGYDSDDVYRSRSRRRLTKSPSVRARRSASLDRYWTPGEDFGGRTPKRRPSEGRPESIISARDQERSVSRFSYVRDVGRSEEEDDLAAKYYWHPERGWIERGAKSK